MRSPLLAIVLFAACFGAVHAGILANGDFNNGSAHWEGDRTTNEGFAPLVITLKPNTWTKIYQDFHSADAALKVYVNYSLSANCTFLPQNGMTGFFLSDGVVEDITGLHVPGVGSIQIPMGGFVGVIVDPTKRLVCAAVMNGKVTTGAQSTSGFFYDLNPHEEKTFYLAFPPGNGTVALTLVQLEPAPNGPTRNQN